MKITNLFFTVLFLFAIAVNAQKNKQDTKKLPSSIYTINLGKGGNSFYSLNKKLKLPHFGVSYVNINAIFMEEYNYSSVYFKDHGKKSSVFISDDYNRYINNKLIRDFLENNDPILQNFRTVRGRIW